MNTKPRIREFPFNRLPRVPLSWIRSTRRCGYRSWLGPVSEVATGLARRIGLGAAVLELRRVRLLRVEDLRAAFPGQWRFAVFADPAHDRTGFLALDPLMTGRLLSRIDPQREPRRDWNREDAGDAGAIAWALSAALEHLAVGEEGWSSWRLFGLLGSIGEVGRACMQEDVLIGSWLSVTAGWEEGFAVWLEPGSSAERRRDERPSPEGATGFAGGFRVALTLEAGRSELSTDELGGLEPGDVVLLSESAGMNPVQLRLGPLIILAHAENHQLRVEQMEIHPDQGGMPMEPAEFIADGSGAGLDAAEVGRLPVRLTAETGRVELSVAQLLDLKPGDVLAFPHDLMAPVDLRAGGRLVARGELVDVDGRRGVRILEACLDEGGLP